MSTVTLTIGPKSYPVACADGEEAHIEALGAIVAEKYAQLGAARAPLEAQNMLFAALFMADELAEARRQMAAIGPARLAELEAQVTQLKLVEKAAQEEIARLKSQVAKTASAPGTQADMFGAAAPETSCDALAQSLEALAARAEALAAALEAGGQSA
ncbi:MAG: cell division protein ZapA [Erythrobacter sp.]